VALIEFELELAALFEPATYGDDVGAQCDLAFGGSSSSHAGLSSHSVPLQFVAESTCIVGTVPLDDVDLDRQRVYKNQPLWSRAFNELGVTRYPEPVYDPRALRIFRQQGLSSTRPASPG
jgi:hypothetical protein